MYSDTSILTNSTGSLGMDAYYLSSPSSDGYGTMPRLMYPSLNSYLSQGTEEGDVDVSVRMIWLKKPFNRYCTLPKIK